jgi:succinate dehydrogenase / fumarate reductase iron-sulfur subunit
MCTSGPPAIAPKQTQPVEIRILRQQPNGGRTPCLQSFHLQVDSRMTVLDALEQIRIFQDHTLIYRHSCHHSACGTCACMINGTPRLACATRVLDLDDTAVVLEPLAGFPCLGDLVVDMTVFQHRLDPDWSILKKAEPVPGASWTEENTALQLEDCIECGACVAACPVSRKTDRFLGPAALAALNRERGKVSGPQNASLLQWASGPYGAAQCDRVLTCSRVCPTRVYPARHIADLRRALAGRKQPSDTR